MATFSAQERIKSKKLLEEVYEKGENLKGYPFRLKYLVTEWEGDAAVKIVVSVPKRSVRKAVRRNRIRRQIKEAYRLNKADLLSQMKAKEKRLALFLIYTGKDDQTYQSLEKKLIELLRKLQDIV